MEFVTIDYTEFKRLVALEVRHKDQQAVLEEEIQDLKMELHRLNSINDHELEELEEVYEYE
ncbi:MAG: hypothetical protein Q4F01_05980 [Staphylococcus rostri]|uniref:hypothetical protein n=1 Tax=Staphylococcus rostri TaxID=522262 RepID=UPI0026DEC371|nr:hypothetical protein [Staphylococcus rostri]MDO5375723.1 hypothetical protein [Staphylococcus rostri]